MTRLSPCLPAIALLAAAAAAQTRYYAYDAVTDSHGVIAPWYHGQNGQLDFRLRVAADTLKRYPWTAPGQAPASLPHYVYSGAWKISPTGEITIPPLSDWANGDLGQRAAYVLTGLVDYYRYSGDAAAIAHLSLMADALLDYCQTPPDHPWPGFLISVPNRGKPYGQADPSGFIQLDIVAEAGLGLVRAAELTGNQRWMAAAKHWADLLAEHCDHRPGVPPWPRYANPRDLEWEDLQTGGVVFLLEFFDELIRFGYRGQGDSLVKARDAGRAYLRDVLLPRWTVNDTWGRNYWDWNDNVQAENVTEFAARYLMEHPDIFPNWRNDTRNLLTLFLNHTGAAVGSRGDVYAGAWAYPESAGCCGTSLSYGPMELAPVYAEYGVLAGSEWAREMARRQMLLATYDAHETGVVEDALEGGAIVAGDWFKIAHPMPLKHVLNAMAWQPEIFAPNRENHLVGTASVVRSVRYEKGRVSYTTFSAAAPAVDVLRLAFVPTTVTAGGKPLARRAKLDGNGYLTTRLANGDCIVTLRHDGQTSVSVAGDDPQQSAPWPDPATERPFTGSQVRVVGSVGPDGGLADVYLDGAQQLAGIDAWCPAAMDGQVLFSRSGLPDGPHTVRVVPRGAGNPRSSGQAVKTTALQWSAATGDAGYGEGGGPTDAQRVICGYPGRTDYVDREGHAWRPATELVQRIAGMDTVAATWWTERRRHSITGTDDPELYRYGVHGHEFTLYFTVGPGTYHARLKLCETSAADAARRAIDIRINGTVVASAVSPAASAGGVNRAADLVFNGLEPQAGVIAIRLSASRGGEAMLQAVEVGPGDGGVGAEPVALAAPAALPGNLLANPGFEEGVTGSFGELGLTVDGPGWRYLFAGSGRGYVWSEAYCEVHPDWGPVAVHGGKEALRTHVGTAGHTVVYQEVPVEPGAPYRAAAWVRAADPHGKGFGTTPGDQTALVIQELDGNGQLVTEHPRVAVTKAGDWTELKTLFTTDAKAERVRFLLESLIGEPYNEAHVTWDDAELARQ
ncbi:MAG: carbohydrate binding domain-containing protein [Armatimonadetes bacterium]|nr:carbohydrate binding domain-containing protein [Armatimonadota bacterium]